MTARPHRRGGRYAHPAGRRGDLLPDEARRPHVPTDEELAATPSLHVTVRVIPAGPPIRARRGPHWPRRRSRASTGCPGPSAVAVAPWPVVGPGSSSIRACWRPLAAGRRVALVTGTNGKTTTTRLLAAALAGTGTEGRQQRHRGQHAGRPRGRAGRRTRPRRWPSSKSTRATSAAASSRPGPRWWCCSTCRATSSTASPRSGCWWTAGGPHSPACPPGTRAVRAPWWWPTPTIPWWPTPRPRPPRSAGWVPARSGTPTPWAARRAVDASASPTTAVGPVTGATSPGPTWRRRVDDDELVLADGTRHPIRIGLPGEFNRANAGMAAVAAAVMLDAAGDEGRGHRARTARRGDRGGRPVLHRRPGRAPGPPVAGQEPGRLDGHLRSARRDGRPGRCGGAVGQRPDRRRLRHVVAVGRPLRAPGRPFRRGDGERRLDLAVRLRYAGVDHDRGRRSGDGHRPRRGPLAGGRPTRVPGNYTAFADLRRAL